MNLGDILHFSQDFEITEEQIGIDIEEMSLCSREQMQNGLFIAISGIKNHGIDYIEQAIKNGAICCITSKLPETKVKIPVILIKDLEKKLAQICEEFFKNRLPENIIAVTGTNGKSSVVDYLRQFYEFSESKVASLGTLGFNSNFGDVEESYLTTPDIVKFYKYLSQSKEHDCDNFIFEASSHGLDQNRIGNIKVNYAVFTNLSHDHLDYHKTMNQYFAAKAILFDNHLKEDGVAIINCDDDYGRELVKICANLKREIITYGKGEDSDVKYKKLSDHEINISIDDEDYLIEHSLYSNFQIENLVAAIAVLYSNGFELSEISKFTRLLKPVAGRMELFVDPKSEAKIVIDYAHTPHALERALKSLKENTQNKLYVVFGCGGDRDKEKRPLMAEIAKKYCDEIIITDDNPRNENPEQIRKDIIKNLKKFTEVPNRKSAIEATLKLLKKGDVLLIAGKGHEEYQIVGDQKYDFSDKKIVELHIKTE